MIALPHLSQYSSWEPMQDPHLHMGHYTERRLLPHLHSPPGEEAVEVESRQTWECHPVEEVVVELGYQQLKGFRQVINLNENFKLTGLNRILTHTACTNIKHAVIRNKSWVC